MKTKASSSVLKITQVMKREASVKALLRVTSRKKTIIDIVLSALSITSIVINMIEVRNIYLILLL